MNYVELFHKFMRSAPDFRTDIPVFFKFSDCKSDNIMINERGEWKLIDLDGVMLSNRSANKQAFQTQVNDMPIYCSFDQNEIHPDNLETIREILQSQSASFNVTPEKFAHMRLKIQKLLNIQE